jgi:hypothetical protein
MSTDEDLLEARDDLFTILFAADLALRFVLTPDVLPAYHQWLREVSGPNGPEVPTREHMEYIQGTAHTLAKLAHEKLVAEGKFRV